MVYPYAGERSLEERGREMEYEVESNRKLQLAALLMTVLVVGGAIAYAVTAAYSAEIP